MGDTEDRSIRTAAEPPLGVLQASVDDKGRLKLPERFQSYLDACGVKRVFITSLDLRLARIYPMDRWLANLKVFESAQEHPEAAERLAFLAKVHGSEADLDPTGRLLLPAKLREALNLDARQPVWLEATNGCIGVMNKKVYDEHMAASMTNMADDLKVLKRMGLV